MATPVSSIPTSLCSSSSFRNPNPQIHIQSSCSFSWVRTLKFSLFSCSSQLGHCHLSSWSGLRHLGASISLRDRRMGRKGRCKGKVLFASLFGVGAPEALVIGVVALLVFGPKGLAEVARNLGKTLRSFQPTIRELQEVSREFKDSLEREIGLDDVRSSSKNMYGSSRANFTSDPSSSVTEDSQGVADPNGAPANRAYSTEEYLKITQEQLKASAAAEPGSTSSSEEGQIEPKTEPQVAVEETAAVIPPQNPEHDTT